MSAVAAAALVPLAETLVSFLPLEKVKTLLETLWNSLLELDELTASTSSILTLLSSLMANPHTEKCLEHLPLNNFVSRLFPFLSHSSTKVCTKNKNNCKFYQLECAPWNQLKSINVTHLVSNLTLNHLQLSILLGWKLSPVVFYR